ncbi:hypothetical protein BDR26DRAFT_878743 [Obelidium mucronatum]|nr:hypothetical protein BDR26DRAFT_878739 [Obelidium mucronatum]KAI9325742.1 hypothetical protein BDR26DRAFT_878743 [Obelidium mucronatum]
MLFPLLMVTGGVFASDRVQQRLTSASDPLHLWFNDITQSVLPGLSRFPRAWPVSPDSISLLAAADPQIGAKGMTWI